MPSRPVSILIILFWLFSTAWLVERDLLPALGVGEITYDRALSARAVEEPVTWEIYRDKESVGTLFFAVEPKPDGRFHLTSRARIRVQVPPLDDTEFNVESVIIVDPLKRLERLSVLLTLPQSKTQFAIHGDVHDQDLDAKLTLFVNDVEQFERDAHFNVDRETMVLDIFGQIDRLPGLYAGKTWRTKFINPVTAMLSGTLVSTSELDFIRHSVVDVETIDWHGRQVPCFKVEHRYQKAAPNSWARQPDGKVLVQEVLFGTTPFRLVADAPNDDQPTPSDRTDS